MRFRIMFAAVGLAALAAARLGAAAWTAAPSPVTVDAVDYAYAMPSTVEGGVVAMRFRNKGREVHEFAMGKVDGHHTLAEVRRAFESGKHVAWLHDVGGPGLLSQGANVEVTRTLAPGKYVFLCAVPSVKGVSHIKLGMIRMFTVVGDGGATAPKADAVITAEAKRYVVPPLHAGLQTIELRNRSGSGRGFQLYTLNPGKTQKDLDRWFKAIETTGKQPVGRPPQTILGAMQTIPNGTSVYLTLRLDAGRTYRLFDDDSGIATRFTPR